nr:hypothetical protein [Candidatus Enterousia merdequi]
MVGFIKNFFRIAIVATVIPTLAFAVQQQNPRATVQNNARNSDSVTNAAIRRSATSVIARSTSANSRKSRTVVTARPATTRAATVRSARPVVKSSSVSRSATKPTFARSGTSKTIVKSGAKFSRAGTSRATAVFNDVTKMGAGYANCRDAYATCMDQLCANANDTYRRCYCSDRFTDFRDTSDRLDSALALLAEFQDNNLNAVDKSAAEVNAMYTATAGEEAIKKDTSASQKLLDSIGDVLSGKSSSQTKKNNLNSLGILDISGFGGVDGDIWGGGSSSIFGGSGVDLSDLEGKELYDSAMKQCSNVVQESCGGDAMFNLAKSAYSIMITQDCNAYEKNINAKKTSVEETIRTAEKYLREARLEEYRAHNSQDVNDCLSRVETALRQPTACGPDYERCLDYTGMYINPSTGEPIYSQALFGLNSLIILNGDADVVKANPDFDNFLEGKKMFATTALDSCRSIADTVWYEFKRSAIIQIAQAQDAKIEEIKNSCVSTMKECYDTQSEALLDYDDTTAQASGAIAAVTARGMCYSKVMACAALYGDPDGCEYNDETKVISPVSGKTCGLQSLLAFADTVDAVKVEEGCEEGLKQYAQELCAPASGDSEHPYPWGCRLRAVGNAGDSNNDATKNTIFGALESYAKTICAQDFVDSDTANTIADDSTDGYFKERVDISGKVQKIVDDIKTNLGVLLQKECSAVLATGKEGNVIWDANGNSVDDSDALVSVSPLWLERVFGNGSDLKSIANTGVTGYTLTIESTGVQHVTRGAKSFGWGVCMIPTIKQLCTMQSGMPGMTGTTQYDSSNHKCLLNNEWYRMRCSDLGGYWTGSDCYVK